MPCGKRSLIKSWGKPKYIRVITPSRYEQNEASVKVHWKNVMRDLELSYKDDQFWETQCDTVRELVGPIMFHRIAKIFNLPFEATQYKPKSETSSLDASEHYYKTTTSVNMRPTFSMSDFEVSLEEKDEEEESDYWSVSSVAESDERMVSRSKSVSRTKSLITSKMFSKTISKSFSKFLSKTIMRTYSSRSKLYKSERSASDESANSSDDLLVHPASKYIFRSPYQRHTKNPHFDMLYCNQSETDMIKWKSKYKQKTYEVSASDEFSKKAEIMTKKISKEFYDWWVDLGNVEFKSEIKRPEDIESLFQVWFDEHASRGLVLDPKILPCVLQSIAKYVGEPKASCPKVLTRQIAYDIHAETSPAHIMAFGTVLPLKMKHIPPKNNTEKMWHSVKIPGDLRSMACVWDDIQHLTSTKEFQKWLEQRPHLPMPQCLKDMYASGEKKHPFVVPSDYVVQDKSAPTTTQDLALPVSQFSIELKEVLSKLMNQ
ncbi:uncharacterized protein LOC131853173 isoform X2 [Achroia grisella]|uniref:uncharacterized protein LOC131853173 isoform X2 n=1 Tax=Achroia grisella TaxID=688607 RepID=UPI0027D1FA54|nr:uncharacterized protein LOC131853173 isoform X2 [Achroia grisella]